MSDAQRLPATGPPASDCRIEVRSDRSVSVIGLQGELDLGTADRVDAELAKAERGGGGTIMLDLSELTYIDSTGIAMLVAAAKRSEANGWRLRIKRSEAPSVQRMVELTGLEGRLPFED